MAAVPSMPMDRGGGGATDAARTHLSGATMLEMRQTKRGFWQECFGCEAKTEFNYLNSEGTKIAHSLEETDCFCRMCCTPCHPFKMTVHEEGNTEAELVSVDRPLRLCAMGYKCCCYQTATFSSGGTNVGSVIEKCAFCVMSFDVLDGQGNRLYVVHPPTCLGGICINCFTEGNPCGRGCCKLPFWIYDANSAASTDGGQAPHLGKILKKPKSLATELFTDASAFEVHFPTAATVEQKAALVGTAIFLNAVFFEGSEY